MAQYTEQAILDKLFIPYEGTGVPPGWTEATVDGKTTYTHTATGRVENKIPTIVSPPSLGAIYSAMLPMDEETFREWVEVLVTNANSVSIVGTEEEQLEFIKLTQQFVNGLIMSISERRSRQTAIREIPATRTEGDAVGSFEQNVSKNIRDLFFNASTFIGPIPIPEGVGISEVEVVENYDVASLRALRSLTDPVIKGSKNDVLLTFTLEYPASMLNDKRSADGSIISYGLSTLLATLKVAPVCEISSSAILPIFVNNLLSKDSFERIRNLAVETTAEGKQAKSDKTSAINRKLTSLSTTAAGPNLPAGAPTESQLEGPFIVSSVSDGDTFYTSTNPSTGSNSIRLISINTPEVAHGSGTVDEPWSQEAKFVLEEIINEHKIAGVPTRKVWLELGAKATQTSSMGTRTLAYAYAKDASGNLFQINLRMAQVFKNLEVSVVAPNTKYKNELKQAHDYAVFPQLWNFNNMLGQRSPLLDYLLGGKDKTDTADYNAAPAVVQDPPTALTQRNTNVTIPAAFRGYIVKTAPGKTNSFFVKLFFSRFNDTAWQKDKIQYRDKDGNLTNDPLNCPWIVRLAKMTFLSNSNPNLFDERMTDYVIPNNDAISFSWEDPRSRDWVSFVPEEKDFTIQDIEAKSFMKVATLPLLGQVYPVVQYLGSANMMVKLTFIVKSSLELAKFHEMKAELDKINYQAGPPAERRAYVRIKNNVLNMLGTKDYVITGITTHKNDQTDVWSVEVELIESRIGSSDIEAIYVKSEEEDLVGDLKKIWDYIYKVLSETVATRNKTTETTLSNDPLEDWYRKNISQAYDLPVSVRGEFEKQYRILGTKDLVGDGNTLDADGELAHRLVFGTDDRGNSSIINMNAMAAAWYYLTQVEREGKFKISSWNTSYQNDPLVSAVMEGALLAPGTLRAAQLFSNDRPGGSAGSLFTTGYRVGADGTPLYSSQMIFTSDSIYNPFSLFYPAAPNVSATDRTNMAKYAFTWLNKGRQEFEQDGDFFRFIARTVEGLAFDSAKLNINEQGKELLNFLGSANRGRRSYFFSKKLWDAYFDILFNKTAKSDLAQHPAWSYSDISAAKNELITLLKSGLYLQFTGIRREKFTTENSRPVYRKTSVDQDSMEKVDPSVFWIPPSNYPDMAMPTYAKMFSDDKSNLLTDKDGNILWKKFAPTYSDLGRKPPFLRSIAFTSIDEATKTIAREVNDPIEPGFFYYHERMKEDQLYKALEKRDFLSKRLEEYVDNYAIRVPTSVARQGSNAIHNFLMQIYNDPSKASDIEAYNRQEDRNKLRALFETARKGDKRARNIGIIDQEGQFLGTVTSGGKRPNPIEFSQIKGQKQQIFSGDGTPAIEAHDSEYISRTHTDLLLRTPDGTFRMNKLFPAYRLFFVEKDSDKTYLVDDLYGINSLVDISVRTDKEDAATLIAKISNTTDNLGYEEVLSPQMQNSLGISQDDAQEPYLSKLKIEPGVLIVLKLGYGSAEEDLETVFTGMVTEVLPGQIIELVAQGHKRELLNEVQFSMDSMNHFDIIRRVLEKCETPNIGKKFKAKTIGLNAIRELFPAGVDPGDFVGYMDTITNTELSDMSNVHVVSNTPLESSRRVYYDPFNNGKHRTDWAASKIWEPLGKFFIQALPDSMMIDWFYSNGKYATWVIPPQPAWEAIQEVVRHRPGHIMDVIPFDNQSTLFVGLPDQSYRAFTPKMYEARTYNILEPYLNKSRKIELHTDLLSPFLKSDWAKIYKAHLKPYTKQDYAEVGFTLASHQHPLFLVAGGLVWSEDPIGLTQLDELTDERDEIQKLDKSEISRKGFLSAIAKHAGLEELPAGFTVMGDWWIHCNDFTKIWDELGAIHRDLPSDLFIWFYDLDPTIAKTVIPTFDEVRALMASPDNKLFEYYIDTLKNNPNGGFAASYQALRRTFVDYKNTGPAFEQVDHLLRNNLISEVEALDIKIRVHDSMSESKGFVPRSDLDSMFSGSNYEVTAKNGNSTLADVFLETGGAFRLFIFYIHRHLVSMSSAKEDLSNKITNNKAAKALEKLRLYDLPPGHQVFRRYHMITGKDLIENNIVATMAEMANSVLVRAPTDEVEYTDGANQVDATGRESETIMVEYEETSWGSYPTTDGVPFSPKIGKENRKLAVVQELNAISSDQKMKTLLTNMGLVIQPMYRGNILVVGQNIKPYDVVYIQDDFKDLRGHFEVASVTHHFSTATGWVTEIEPHALVRVNNPSSEIQLLTMQTFLRDISGVVDVLNIGTTLLLIAGALSSIFTGGLSGAAAAAAASGTAATSRGLMYRLGLLFAPRFGAAAASAAAKATLVASLKNATVAFGRSTFAKSSWSVFSWFLGNFTGPGVLYGLVGANLGVNVADVATSIYIKHQLNSLTLPIDVHLLQYRGQRFHAGLDRGNEDIYGIYDKLFGVASDTRQDIEDTIVGVGDLLYGLTGNLKTGTVAEQVIKEQGDRR